jgi:hypothetical protein
MPQYTSTELANYVDMSRGLLEFCSQWDTYHAPELCTLCRPTIQTFSEYIYM